MDKKIKFYLPDFTRLLRFNMTLVKFLKKKPQYFREGVEIGALYGAFPNSCWNGARAIKGECDEYYMRRALKTLEIEGIPVRFTFSNPHITEQMLDDKRCNLMLKLAENPSNGIKNGVIVVSEILEGYVRKNYPSYEIISSTCKCITDKTELREELKKDYNMVVLDYNFNNDFEFLADLENKDKCELLVNELCIPQCPNRKRHYGLIGEDILRLTGASVAPQGTAFDDCPCKNLGFHDIKSQKTFITVSDIWEKYEPMGFRNFKIEGRLDYIFNLLDTYLYYMSNPDYTDILRSEILIELMDIGVIKVSQ